MRSLDFSSPMRALPIDQAASVCIPAHNEACGIETTLRSVLGQDYDRITEVLVCVNGSTDGTAARVRSIGAEEPRVRLIETKAAGKANAWNILRAAATGRLLFFMDADVYLLPDAFALLSSALAGSPTLVAAGARCVPVNVHTDPLARLTLPAPGPAANLSGGLYAVDTERLARRLAFEGYDRMPADIINEDLWLSLVIGERYWAEVAEARALYVHPQFSEGIRTARRCLWGRRQLRRTCAHLCGRRGFSFGGRLRTNLKRAVRSGSPGAFLRVIAGSMVLRLFALCTTGVTPHRPWLKRWAAAESSKRLVPLLPDHARRGFSGERRRDT